jgi:ADP-ribose pyrophosphatase
MSESKKTLAEGKHLRLVDKSGWECVERIHGSSVVGIVAITNESKLLLIEQYRRPLERVVIELPAGLVGDTAAFRGEELSVAAHRELEEETGYRAGKMVCLGSGAISAGMSDEMITTFLATELTRVGPGGGDETEDIKVFEVPVGEVDRWLADRLAKGAVLDVKVYAGLFLMQQETANRRISNRRTAE